MTCTKQALEKQAFYSKVSTLYFRRSLESARRTAPGNEPNHFKNHARPRPCG